MDVHENSIIEHQISPQKSDQVFANSTIKHPNNSKVILYKHSKDRKFYYKTFEFENFELLRRFKK